MSADSRDALVAEARRWLAEQEAEERGASAELGVVLELDEYEAFTGRWRGDGTAATRRGVVDVPLFWDGDSGRRFMWPKARLTQELDDHRPIEIGAAIAIVRGADIPNSDPDRNPTQRYAVRVRACDDPLPGEESAALAPAGGADDLDDDIRFETP